MENTSAVERVDDGSHRRIVGLRAEVHRRSRLASLVSWCCTEPFGARGTL